MAARMAQNPEEMLKTLAHEELGLSEQAFPNPWRSAVSATAALGAAVPVLPYLFTTGLSALVISFIISTLAHFGVGAAKVVVTGRIWWKSGLQTMLIGLGEAAITYRDRASRSAMQEVEAMTDRNNLGEKVRAGIEEHVHRAAR